MLRSRTGKKLAVLIGSQLDVYSRVQKGKKIRKKKQRAIFYVQSEVVLEKEAANQPKNLQQCSCDISRDSVRSNTYELLTKCEVKI